VAVALVEYGLTISVVGSGTTDPAPGDYTYAEGTTVTITAYPSAGWKVDHWEVNGSYYAGEVDSISLTMNDNYGVVVYFVEQTFTLTISATSGGTADPPPGSYTYSYDQQVTITAIPDTGYAFSHWSIDGLISMTNPLTLTMTRDYSVEATFVEAPTATITGTVVNAETNEPIAGATISVDNIATTTSGSDGKYSLIVPIGVYTLKATVAGFYDWSSTVDVSAEGTYVIDIPMTPIPPPSPVPTSIIKGTVIDQEGNPVVGATVTADGYTTVTDVEGKFSLTVEPGVYTVTIKAQGYKEWSKEIDASTAGTYVISPVLEKAAIEVRAEFVVGVILLVAVVAAVVYKAGR